MLKYFLEQEYNSQIARFSYYYFNHANKWLKHDIYSHLHYRKEDILLYRLVYTGFFLDAMSLRCLPVRAHMGNLSVVLLQGEDYK